MYCSHMQEEVGVFFVLFFLLAHYDEGYPALTHMYRWFKVKSEHYS